MSPPKSKREKSNSFAPMAARRGKTWKSYGNAENVKRLLGLQITGANHNTKIRSLLLDYFKKAEQFFISSLHAYMTNYVYLHTPTTS